MLKSEILEPPFIQSVDAIFTQKVRYRDADVKKIKFNAYYTSCTNHSPSVRFVLS